MSEPVDQEMRNLLAQIEGPGNLAPEGQISTESSSKKWLVGVGLPALFAIAIYFSFSPAFAASQGFWTILCGTSLPLASVSLWSYRGQLFESLKPKQGDLSLGFALAGFLILVCIAGRSLFAEASTEQHAWLLRIFLQVGPAKELEANPIILGQLFLIIVAEELMFRGAVFSAWESIIGRRRGWIMAALSYALALSPTLYQLRVDGAGLNPLLFLAALAAGLVWCFAKKVSRRMGPGIIAHLIFAYFMLTQLRPPGL